jgi:hypothetical protein
MRGIVPTSAPSPAPTGQPTLNPTGFPSSNPSSFPSGIPTRIPTGKPSQRPSGLPTGNPTNLPTHQPTINPSGVPTSQPNYKVVIQSTQRFSAQIQTADVIILFVVTIFGSVYLLVLQHFRSRIIIEEKVLKSSFINEESKLSINDGKIISLIASERDDVNFNNSNILQPRELSLVNFTDISLDIVAVCEVQYPQGLDAVKKEKNPVSPENNFIGDGIELISIGDKEISGRIGVMDAFEDSIPSILLDGSAISDSENIQSKALFLDDIGIGIGVVSSNQSIILNHEVNVADLSETKGVEVDTTGTHTANKLLIISSQSAVDLTLPEPGGTRSVLDYSQNSELNEIKVGLASDISRENSQSAVINNSFEDSKTVFQDEKLSELGFLNFSFPVVLIIFSTASNFINAINFVNGSHRINGYGMLFCYFLMCCISIALNCWSFDIATPINYRGILSSRIITTASKYYNFFCALVFSFGIFVPSVIRLLPWEKTSSTDCLDNYPTPKVHDIAFSSILVNCILQFVAVASIAYFDLMILFSLITNFILMMISLFALMYNKDRIEMQPSSQSILGVRRGFSPEFISFIRSMSLQPENTIDHGRITTERNGQEMFHESNYSIASIEGLSSNVEDSENALTVSTEPMSSLVNRNIYENIYRAVITKQEDSTIIDEQLGILDECPV